MFFYMLDRNIINVNAKGYSVLGKKKINTFFYYTRVCTVVRAFVYVRVCLSTYVRAFVR